MNVKEDGEIENMHSAKFTSYDNVARKTDSVHADQVYKLECKRKLRK